VKVKVNFFEVSNFRSKNFPNLKLYFSNPGIFLSTVNPKITPPSLNYSKFQYFYVGTHKIITFQSSVFLLRHFSVLLVVLHNSRKREIFLGSFFCTCIFNYFPITPVLFPVYKREIEKKSTQATVTGRYRAETARVNTEFVRFAIVCWIGRVLLELVEFYYCMEGVNSASFFFRKISLFFVFFLKVFLV